MKISVDGGGLGLKNNKRYGNFIFSDNLIKAINKYDNNNQYYIYTLTNLKPSFGWLKVRLSVEEIIKKKDVFLALNQAIPLYISGKVISFSHGLSYYFYPNLYSSNDLLRLKSQLDEMIERSKYIIVSSLKVKKEMLLINKKIENKIIVLPFGMPFDMKQNEAAEEKNIKRKNYFLFVGMNHPIKNVNFIKKAFKTYKKITKDKNIQLKIITKNCSRVILRRLYRNAKALLTASFYESFNFPVLEALSQGTPVIGLKSAIIPELEPYVNIVNKEEDFINRMIKIKITPNRKIINDLKNKFNWENYVKKLVELY